MRIHLLIKSPDDEENVNYGYSSILATFLDSIGIIRQLSHQRTLKTKRAMSSS